MPRRVEQCAGHMRRAYATEQSITAYARTDVTDERTNEDHFSPTSDTSSSVTRTRTYGFAEVNR